MAGRQEGSIVEEAPPRAGTREWLIAGSRMIQAGELSQAEPVFRRLTQHDPEGAEAWFFLGYLEQNRGNDDEAVAHYRRAIGLAPDLAEAHNNLGVVLQRRGRFHEAEPCFRRAVEAMSDYAEAHNNLGNVLQDQGRFEEALGAYRRALGVRPGYVEAYRHMGNAHRALGRFDQALACYETGLGLAPDHILLHTSRGMLRIQQGDLKRGWPELEWRLRGHDSPIPRYPRPMWDGAPLEGRTILVHCEQGLGDTIHFLRYATPLQRRGGRVLVVCKLPLMRIASTCPGVGQVAADTGGMPPLPFDVHIPLISLPRVLGTTLDTIPAEIPYLFPDGSLVDAWRDELRAIEGFKVGIVWRGNPLHTRDRERSFPPALFEAIARVPGVRLFSLQKNGGRAELDELAGRFEVLDLSPRLRDLVDTAAVMKNLDLVITPDSSPAHLAGALGVPAWVALPFIADWRWMSEREDTPWYPSLRLFRQRRFGDWSDVFARMAAALASVVPPGAHPA
jgi:Tfp pilus assembly protein PilF